MPKTVQIRDIDDDTYAALAVRAAAEGISVPEYLRREIARLAARPTIAEWLDRTLGRRLESRPSDAVAVLNEIRGD
jgi:plasmid stability protein